MTVLSHNQGDLFKISSEATPIVSLDNDGRAPEYIVKLTFEAINMTEDCLRMGVTSILQTEKVEVDNSRLVVNIVGTKEETEIKFLNDLASDLICFFQRRIPDWGEANKNDRIFVDDYHNLD